MAKENGNGIDEIPVRRIDSGRAKICPFSLGGDPDDRHPCIGEECAIYRKIVFVMQDGSRQEIEGCGLATQNDLTTKLLSNVASIGALVQDAAGRRIVTPHPNFRE